MSSKTDADAGRSRWTMLLVVTVLCAAALRFLGLQSGLWHDEIVTLVLSARHPLRQIVTEYPDVNIHPLYSVLAHASLVAFGDSAWSLRLPACLFGIASIVMVYRLGTRLTTRAEAWAGAVVLATSYHHIWFSQNGRGYTLLGFLTLASTSLLLRADQTGRRRDYMAYGLVCVTGLYAHLTMAFVVAGHVVAMLLDRSVGWRQARQPLAPLVWAWSGAGILSAVAYAPLAVSYMTLRAAAAPGAAANIATPGWALREVARGLFSDAGAVTTVVGSALALTGAASLWRRRPFEFTLLIAPGVVTALAIAALGQPMRPRFFFFLSGAAAIFVGRGIGAAAELFIRGRTVPANDRPSQGIVLGVVLLAGISVAALPRNYLVPKQDFDGAVRFLEQAQTQGAQVVAAGPACLPLDIYYGRAWRCMKSADDWPRADAGADRVLAVYTLADYIGDPRLSERLRTDCPIVRQFSGTLGGGDIIVCEVKAGVTQVAP